MEEIMPNEKRRSNGPPPMGGSMPRSQLLTDEQKKAVKDIFSRYDLSKLTGDDAKGIFKSLEESGIRGPGLHEAVEATGMDPEKFWTLAHGGEKMSQSQIQTKPLSLNKNDPGK
jgi:hypothetical protein